LTASAGVLTFPSQFFEGAPPLDGMDRDPRECVMTWQMEATEIDPFELKARHRSNVYDRDPFEDEEAELEEDGELEDGDDEDLEDEEDEDEFDDDDDDYEDDDDLEEEEEEEEDDF
jgi:hypothetical protein